MLLAPAAGRFATADRGRNRYAAVLIFEECRSDLAVRGNQVKDGANG